MEKLSITPSIVIEYLYCPRFIYFMKILNISQNEDRRFKVTKGRVCTMLSRWEQQGMVERLDRGVYKKSYRQEVL